MVCFVLLSKANNHDCQKLNSLADIDGRCDAAASMSIASIIADECNRASAEFRQRHMPIPCHAYHYGITAASFHVLHWMAIEYHIRHER